MKMRNWHSGLYRRFGTREGHCTSEGEERSVWASVRERKPITGRILPTLSKEENELALCRRLEFRL
jgi:hypothetical protein